MDLERRWRDAILHNKVDEVAAMLDAGLSPTEVVLAPSGRRFESPLSYALDILDEWPWTYEIATMLLSASVVDAVVVREDSRDGDEDQPHWRLSTALGRAIFNRNVAQVAFVLQFGPSLAVVEIDEVECTQLPALALGIECDDVDVCRTLVRAPPPLAGFVCDGASVTDCVRCAGIGRRVSAPHVLLV